MDMSAHIDTQSHRIRGCENKNLKNGEEEEREKEKQNLQRRKFVSDNKHDLKILRHKILELKRTILSKQSPL